MKKVEITNVTPAELVDLINEGVKNQLQEFTAKSTGKVKSDDKPHLTRKSASEFFDVSTKCIDDWSKKGILTPFKVGQRTYFSKEQCIKVLFNRDN